MIKDKVLEEIFNSMYKETEDEQEFECDKYMLEKAIELTEKLTREDILRPSNPQEEKRRYDQIQQARADERATIIKLIDCKIGEFDIWKEKQFKDTNIQIMTNYTIKVLTELKKEIDKACST